LNGERSGRKSTPSALPLVPRSPHTFDRRSTNGVNATFHRAQTGGEVEVVVDVAPSKRPWGFTLVAAFAIGAVGFLSHDAQPHAAAHVQSSIAPARDPKPAIAPPAAVVPISSVAAPAESIAESPTPSAADEDSKASEAAKRKRAAKLSAHKPIKKHSPQFDEDEIDVGF
jgi:hypothetical protein